MLWMSGGRPVFGRVESVRLDWRNWEATWEVKSEKSVSEVGERE